MPTPPRPSRVHDVVNAQAIQTYWEIACESLKDFRKQHRVIDHGNKAAALNEECARLIRTHRSRLPIRPTYDTLPKMWRVAKEYGRSDIEKIVRRVAARVSRFTPSHLIRLLYLPAGKGRDKLMFQAIDESWTRRALSAQVQAARGRRRKNAGRKPIVPKDKAGLRVELEKMAITWLRWTVAVVDKLEPEEAVVVGAADKKIAAVRDFFAQGSDRKRK